MIGKTVGKYRILDRLGRGGMGTVYLALDETLDREVAIKVLNPDLGESDVLKRFRAEAVTLARLNHPGIATIFELHRHDDDLLMVMEFVRGETFQALSDRIGPMAIPQAAHLCMQVLDALGHAHRAGVVHRDLKLANVMVAQSGAVKVMDFGIARVLGTEHFTQGGYMMGTPAYMAPEQVLEQDVDGRADLYAVGVMLYRLLAGELPFKADTSVAMIQKQIADPPTPIAAVRPDLPEWCGQLLDRTLAKSPADRFQTAEEFRAALAASVRPEALGEMPTIATPAPNGTARDATWVPGTGSTKTGSVSGARPVPEDTTRRVGRPAADPPTAPTTGSIDRTTTTVVLGRSHVVLLSLFMLIFAIGVLVLGYIALSGRREAPQQQAAAPQTAATPAPAATPPVSPPPATSSGTKAESAAPTAPPVPPPSPPAPSAPAKGGALASPDGRRGRADVPPIPPGTGQPLGPAGRRGRPGTLPEPPDAAAAGRGEAAPARPEEPRTPPADAFPPLLVPDVHLVVDPPGRGPGRERDGVMRMAEGAITVLDKPGGTVLRSLPYTALAAAFVTRSKQPRWRAPDGSEAGVNVNLKLGFLRSDRTWLILIGRDNAPIVIRLEDAAPGRVVGAIQNRTGVAVERYVPKRD